MSFKQADKFHQLTTRFLAIFQRQIKLIPALSRKPKILRYWLLSAHKVQIISLALLLLIPFIILPFADFLLASIFSPVTEETLFGLIKTELENPYVEILQNITLWLVWIISSLYCITLLLEHIPNTLQHAAEVVKEKTLEADEIVTTNPSASILLYNSARQWSLHDEDETALNTKLQYANVVAYNHHKKTQLMPTETIAISNTNTVSTNALIAERYKVKQLIGSGAMGNVYLGEDTLLKRDIALKQLSPSLSHDKHIIARFRQEALALARLSHPNIVQVFDFIEGEDFLWIMMELVTGGELEDKLSNSTLIKPKDAIRLTLQMADALGYAHKQGVIHRDFKPANVLMTENGDIKITDFGIAKLAQSSIHTQLNTIMGTPSHMSPEQANGEEADHRTDIYALGIILFQMLSGELPFSGDAKAIIAQHLGKQAPNLSLNKSKKNNGITAELNNIVQKMLAKETAKRFQSMDDVINELSKQKK